MARLTNRQLDALAARVTDLLQEAHDEQVKEVVESSKYINFENTYADEYVDKLRPLVKEITEAEQKVIILRNRINFIREEGKSIEEKILGYTLPTWNTPEPKNTLNNYLQNRKNELFKGTKFDRDKTLRRVEADILLSDVANPEELVKSLVAKLGK